MTTRPVNLLLLVAAACLLFGWPFAGAQEAPETKPETGLSPLEERGKQIYTTGQSDDEIPITAMLGADGVEVPAAAMPCANCHGPDGKGRPEGGVTPSNITWQALTKSYGVRHESGREHPPYTLRSLKRSISMGVDPAGNELHAAMPRYRMSLGDMDALLAYLQKLGTDRDPGVLDDTLRLGTFLPADGPGGLGDVVKAVLDAYLSGINADGGIYGRTVELQAFRLPREADGRADAAAQALDETPVFALVGAVVAGADTELVDLVESRKMPLVGPFTQHPRTGFGRNHYVFYLLGGIPTQGRVLVDLARERLADGGDDEARPRMAVVTPDDETSVAAADAVGERAEEAFEVLRHDLPSGPMSPTDVADLARRIAAEGAPEALLALHPVVLEPAFLIAAQKAGWTPHVFAPGSLTGSRLFDAPLAFRDRIHLAFPTLPSDQTPRGARLFGELAREHDLPRRHLAVQLSTLASAEILVEALKRAGRDVSRESLVATLEALYDYETGLTPPVTYTPNRRIGAEGAYVVAVDLDEKQFRPEGGFRVPR